MDTKDEAQELAQQEGYDFMSAVFEVYNELGFGFLEEVYHECLESELAARGIPFSSKVKLAILYKGCPLKKTYEADLVIGDKIIVELKAAKNLAPEHEAQIINYLKATLKRVGYLINFGAFPRIQWKRFVV